MSLRRRCCTCAITRPDFGTEMTAEVRGRNRAEEEEEKGANTSKREKIYAGKTGDLRCSLLVEESEDIS